MESQPPLILRIIVLSLLVLIALSMVFIVTRNGLTRRLELVDSASSRFEKGVDEYLAQLESIDGLLQSSGLGSLQLDSEMPQSFEQRVARFSLGSRRLNERILELAHENTKLSQGLLSLLSKSSAIKQEVGNRYDEYLQQLSLLERSKNLIFNIPAARALRIGSYPVYDLRQSLKEPY